VSQRDIASEGFGRWVRARAGVATDKQTEAPTLTPEQQAAKGGADGGARGPEPQRSESDRLDQAIRDAALAGGSHRIMDNNIIRERFVF
jgi:hypothetical protein